MARCCAVINGEGIYGNLILHQVLLFYAKFWFTQFVPQAQEEAPTSIDGTIKGLHPVSI